MKHRKRVRVGRTSAAAKVIDEKNALRAAQAAVGRAKATGDFRPGKSVQIGFHLGDVRLTVSIDNRRDGGCSAIISLPSEAAGLIEPVECTDPPPNAN